MAGEEEADRLELARQPVGRHQGLAGRSSIGGGRARCAAEEVVLACRSRPRSDGCRRRIDAIDIGERRGAVDAELIEGAGRGEGLERALVDEARIDARGEIRHVA